MADVKWIEISKSALGANIAVARELLSVETALGAVVKANAYGHGIALLAPLLDADERIDALCVVDIAEARRLRDFGVKKTIILIGYLDPTDAEAAVSLNIVPFVFSQSTISALAKAGSQSNTKIRIILKLDTGMGRLGMRSDEIAAMIELINEKRHLEIAGFATHFAQSDAPECHYTTTQKKRFDCVIEEYSGLITTSKLNTASNSGGILMHPDAHHDLARFGISMYGLHPSEHTLENSSVALKPILEFKTRVIHIQNVSKGDSVSYGSTWTAEKDARIAVLPIGYSDGYLRAYAKGARALINGTPCPIRGRICMNFTMFDVSNLERVDVGDIATLISADSESGCSVDDLARIADTINYEVVTLMPEHLPRILVG